MGLNFSKLNDPEFIKELERKRKEQEEREEQMNKWREATVGATGHRPDKMGGWKDALGGYNNQHPLVVALRTSLLDVLEELIVQHGKTRFVSGGALGFDSLFFWSVNHLKKKYPHIENVVAIPFKNQHMKWQKQQQAWYFKMLDRADHVFDVAKIPEYSTREDKKNPPIPLEAFSRAKMMKRNEFMVDQSGIMVAFYDGSTKGGTYECIRYINKGLLHRPAIIRLDPRYNFKPEYI